MSRGLTSLEALIGIFTFSILSVGIISLAVIGTRLAIDSERRVVALALVNERLEFIRSLSYEHVALAPGGALVQQERVTRNQQPYELTTLVEIVDPPAGLKKKVQVTAEWLVPAGGTRDVQVVTLVAATVSAAGAEQITCVPGNTPSGALHYAYSDNFLDSSFAQCLADCHQAAKKLPSWQCCDWSVKYDVQLGLTGVDAQCECRPLGALPRIATDHPSPGSDQYTKLARECADGTRCGTRAGRAVGGTLYCDANCLKEPGDCVCVCPP